MDLVAHHVAGAVDLHDAGLHDPVEPRLQAAQPGGELGRKHVHRAIRKIDGGAPPAGVPIEGAAFGDVVRDIRDVHAETDVSAAERLQRDGVVEIAGRLAVDGHGDEMSEVRAPAPVRRPQLVAEALRFVDRLRIVCVGDTVRAQDDADIDTGYVERAEHLDHPAGWASSRCRIARQLRHHQVAGTCAALLATRNLYIHRQPPVEGHDVAVRIVPSDELRRRPLHDAQDPALGPTPIGTPLDAHHYPVAVHRLMQIGARDVHVAGDTLRRMIGRDEPEAARVHLHPARHQVHPVRQPVAVAANADEVTAFDESRETAA